MADDRNTGDSVQHFPDAYPVFGICGDCKKGALSSDCDGIRNCNLADGISGIYGMRQLRTVKS